MQKPKAENEKFTVPPLLPPFGWYVPNDSACQKLVTFLDFNCVQQVQASVKVACVQRWGG